MFGFGKRRVEKLDFLVAGAQKSGTTALNYYLKRHPRIALPVKKELHFFDNDELFAGGNVSYEPLYEMFRPARSGSIAGENSPIYLYWRPALPRIRDYNPAMKFIVILRNPIERAFSLSKLMIFPTRANFAMKSEWRYGKFCRARLADWRRCWVGIAPIGAKPSIDEVIPRMRLTAPASPFVRQHLNVAYATLKC